MAVCHAASRASGGCFCPLHLAEFSRRTGRKWSREEVVSMLEKNGKGDDAKAWEAVKIDSLRRLFKTIREGFGDSIPGMLCVCWSKCHKEHAREFAEILALPGQTPVVRGNGAPEMMPRYYEATLFSESYKAAMIRWLKLLEGQLPGGVCYQGVGPVTCMAGLTAEGENIVVLNALDLDGDEAPELLFEKEPSAVERLMGDGTWKDVRFEKIGDNVVHLHSRISVQEAAIFRCRVRK